MLKLIYPNFDWSNNFTTSFVKIDKYRVEYLDETIYQIDSFETGCGVVFLQEYSSDAIPETILVHEEHFTVYDFVETDSEYTLSVGEYEYNV